MAATNKVTFALSLLAVLLSIASFFSTRGVEGAEEKPQAVNPTTSSVAKLPQPEPDLVGMCSTTGPAKSLEDLMLRHMNGAMTKISFALHHDAGEMGQRMELVAACAVQLLESVSASPTFQPEINMDQFGDYYQHLNSLQRHSHAMKVAAMEGNHQDALHWYSHVKQDCISCHTRFREE